MDNMDNLFGEEFEEKEENTCSQPTPKKGKKDSGTKTSTPAKPKMSEETELGVRTVQVKMYNDFYLYEAPEDNEKPTIGDVRKWLVGRGFSELTQERSQFVWIEPGEEADKYLYAGVKFEKQG